MSAAPDPEVLRYAAFSAAPGGGNPAGIVLGAAGLSESDMLRIAAEVGYPETAFLLGRAGADGERRYRIRYWSPAAEVPFCGHATVATAVVLAEREGPGPMVFDLFSLHADDLDLAYPPRESFAGNWHPMLVVRDAEIFHQFRFAPEPVAELMRAQGWTGTITVLHATAADEFLARNIFPVGRITEDPATGSAAAATGAYLREIGRVPVSRTVRIHQGAHVGRPSLLTVAIPDAGGIAVSGGATPIVDRTR
jgi:predicted PhzF superfamily epimerase YddE/YHI9